MAHELGIGLGQRRMQALVTLRHAEESTAPPLTLRLAVAAVHDQLGRSSRAQWELSVAPWAIVENATPVTLEYRLHFPQSARDAISASATRDDIGVLAPGERQPLLHTAQLPGVSLSTRLRLPSFPNWSSSVVLVPVRQEDQNRGSSGAAEETGRPLTLVDAAGISLELQLHTECVTTSIVVLYFAFLCCVSRHCSFFVVLEIAQTELGC
jgi:hypothetical protein